MAANPSDDREAEQERLDRELDQLLQEVRVAMPGVQVLFAFLLTVPFQQGFARVTDFQRHLYLVTLLAAAVASAFFIAPTAYHRIMFRRPDRPHLIRLANRMAVVGLIALGVAMNGAVLVVTSYLFENRTAVVVVGVMGSLYAWLWFGIALARRLPGERSH